MTRSGALGIFWVEVFGDLVVRFCRTLSYVVVVSSSLSTWFDWGSGGGTGGTGELGDQNRQLEGIQIDAECAIPGTTSMKH